MERVISYVLRKSEPSDISTNSVNGNVTRVIPVPPAFWNCFAASTLSPDGDRCRWSSYIGIIKDRIVQNLVITM